jgi:hypothetical protein
MLTRFENHAWHPIQAQLFCKNQIDMWWLQEVNPEFMVLS